MCWWAAKKSVCAKDDTAGTAELEIPLSAVGMIYAVKQRIPFAAAVGNDRYNGEMAYAYGEIKIADNFDNLAAQPCAKNLALDKTTQEVYTTQDEGGLHYKVGTLTADGNMLNYPNWNAGIIKNSIGWAMSFTADFNDLPVADELGYLALCGFSIDVRAEEYVRIGFFADDKGNVRVSLYDEPADLTRNFDTGVEMGDVKVTRRATITMNKGGETETGKGAVAGVINPAGMNREATWTSSNPKIATVDGEGNVLFVGSGTVTITGEVAGVVGSVTYNVKAAPAEITGRGEKKIIFQDNYESYTVGENEFFKAMTSKGYAGISGQEPVAGVSYCNVEKENGNQYLKLVEKNSKQAWFKVNTPHHR